MMTNNKVYKLHEFPAHSATVNAARLGHKSGRVLVTGGGDKKVNLWAVGKPNCIMSLSGHSTPISCVQFSINEEHVCAGSHAGALKIWDLESAKILRTLTGHRSSIKSVDFHPYGDFLASGSSDSGIKMWDIRRKGCIFGYKGHNSTVNSLKFSPDGQWIASGGDDNLVKLWDIRVGKVLAQFNQHLDAVTSVEFHPHEFLLASGSADRTVKFFDLETFELVLSSNNDTSSIRCIHFHPDGGSLFAASAEMLRVHSWEPPAVLNAVPTNWSKVQDIAVSQQQLVGVSSQMTNVSVYVADLRNSTDKSPESKSAIPSGHLRRNFKKEPCSEFVQSLNSMVANEESESEKDGEDSQTLPVLFYDTNSRQGFQPHRDLARTPPPEEELRLEKNEGNYGGLPSILTPQAEPAKRLAKFKYVTTVTTGPDLSQSVYQSSPESMSGRRPGTLEFKPMLTPPTSELYSSHSTEDSSSRQSSFSASDESTGPPSGRNLPMDVQESHSIPTLRAFPEPTNVVAKDGPREIPVTITTNSPRSNVVASNSTQSLQPIPRNQERPLAQCQVKPMVKSSTPTTSRLNSFGARSQAGSREAEEFIPNSLDKPSGVSIEDFMPKQNSLGLVGLGGENNEVQVLSNLLREHQSILAVLLARLRNLRIVYNIWQSKDIKAALETAVDLRDTTVVVDLLCVLVLKPSIWSLDICVIVLPSIFQLIQSKYEAHMLTGCNALRLILKNFIKVIKNNIESPISTVGVDISREERYSKSLECYQTLIQIRSFTLKRQTLQGKVGNSFRELHNLLLTLD